MQEGGWQEAAPAGPVWDAGTHISQSDQMFLILAGSFLDLTPGLHPYSSLEKPEVGVGLVVSEIL